MKYLTKDSKKQQGITLIILVVTIVVILILAAITIDLAFDENGIIKKAKELQETINQSTATEEKQLEELSNAIASGNYSGGSGIIPDSNNIEGGGEDDTKEPSAPKFTINGTIGEEGCYKSDIEIVVTANDRAHTLTYTVEGTGIEQGSVETETSIGNGQSIHITQDGTYKILLYEYNREGKKSEASRVQVTRDTVAPIAQLEVTQIQTNSINVQLVATDPEPSAGLSTETPYTFYYQEQESTTWIEAGTGSTSSYTYTGLTENKTYHLKAEIMDKAGNTGTSNVVKNIKLGGEIEITNTPEWTDPNLKPNEGASFTITTNVPVKIEDETQVTLIPNTTGSTVKIEIVNPDENGYGTEVKITIIAGTENGEETVVIGEGALKDEKGNTLSEITQPGIKIYNEPPTVGEIETPGEAGGTVNPAGTPIEIVITPSSPDVSIDPSKFIPVDESGNPIDATVDVSIGEDGKIHITIIPGENTPDGTINILIQPGGITDPAENENEETKIETGVKVDTTKPSAGEISKPEEGTGTQTGNQFEITITPSETDVTIDPEKFIPVDKEGNPIDVKVDVTIGEDGNIHVIITPGENAPDGPMDVIIEEGAITDKAGNQNEEIKIENVTTIDNTKPGIEETITTEGGEGIQAGGQAEIIIKPSEPNVTIDLDKITPIDKEGSPVEVEVEATIGEDGNIHITITPGKNVPDGPIDVIIGEGAITDKAGNQNEETKIENVTTIDNTKPEVEVGGERTEVRFQKIKL